MTKLAEGTPVECGSQVARGARVEVREVDGGWLAGRVATSVPVYGREYVVVWVALADEWAAAVQDGRDPDAVPWPVEDVRLARVREGR